MKTQKMLPGLGVIAIFLIAVGIFVATGKDEGLIRLSPEDPYVGSPGPRGASEVYVGYGWSTKEDPKEAVEEAIYSVKEGLGGKPPEYAILFSTVGYDFDEVLGEFRRLLPDTRIYGGTSSIGVLTKDGPHVSETGSMAILAVSSPKIDFGVGGANLDESSSAREAGKDAILAAIKNAKRDGEIPKLVLMSSSPGEEEEILRGIGDVIGNDVPVIGSTSADNDISGKWRQFANGRVYSNGISLTAIFTDLKVGWAFESGYLRTEKMGTVTRAKGRVIYEIDNKPAAEVYNEWTGGVVGNEIKTGGTVLRNTTLHPMAKVIPGNGKETHYLSIHPVSVNVPEKSITVLANVEEGEDLMLMHGNWELLLNRAETTPNKAMSSKDIAKKDIAFGIYIYCAGTLLSIPEDERSKITLLVGNTIGDAPFIGTFSFGEQGYLSGAGNRHGNLVNSMIIFSRDEE